MDPTDPNVLMLQALAGPVAKPGQTVAQPDDIVGGIQRMPYQAANFLGDITGVNDAIKALRGQMTPEEAKNFTSAHGLRELFATLLINITA